MVWSLCVSLDKQFTVFGCCKSNSYYIGANDNWRGRQHHTQLPAHSFPWDYGGGICDISGFSSYAILGFPFPSSACARDNDTSLDHSGEYYSGCFFQITSTNKSGEDLVLFLRSNMNFTINFVAINRSGAYV